MNAIVEPALKSGLPSEASRAMIERLINFNTVSRDSNLGLIECVRDYLQSMDPVALDQLAQCERFMHRILDTGYAK